MFALMTRRSMDDEGGVTFHSGIYARRVFLNTPKDISDPKTIFFKFSFYQVAP